jgi:DNA-binding CsgD family transcriptional regulator
MVVSNPASGRSALSEHQEAPDDAVASIESLFVPRLDSTREVFLFAREVLKGERPELVFAALDQTTSYLQKDESVEAAVLRGAALVALGRLDDGIAILQPAMRSGNDRLRMEAACELARAYLSAGRLDNAETALSPFLGGEGAGEPYLAARALSLYGRVERERGRRTVAARYYLEALTALDRAQDPFHTLRNALLHDTAVAAVETLEPRLFERVRERMAAVDRIHPEYGALQRARVSGELLCGNMTSAWDIAFSATRSRRGVQYVAALFDLATVSHAAGDDFSATRLTLAAAEGAKFVDWGRGDTGERRALLRLVAALVPVDPNRAGTLLRLYEGLRPIAHQSRDATTAHALARAALFGARKRSPEQHEALAQAAQCARDAGDHYGEVEILLAFVAAGGDDQALRRADELTGLVPRSWLRRRYEALEQTSVIARLSPAERRVMDAICEGLSTEDIAARFGRSKHTIRNQTRRVYEVLGVHTRSALVAKCAAVGCVARAVTHFGAI